MGNFAENLNLGNRFRPPLILQRQVPAPLFVQRQGVWLVCGHPSFAAFLLKKWLRPAPLKIAGSTPDRLAPSLATQASLYKGCDVNRGHQPFSFSSHLAGTIALLIQHRILCTRLRASPSPPCNYSDTRQRGNLSNNFFSHHLVGTLRGGQKRLPKFKFSAKFPIGLHVILQIQIKKFENDCYLMWKIILTENPSRCNLAPLLK